MVTPSTRCQEFPFAWKSCQNYVYAPASWIPWSRVSWACLSLQKVFVWSQTSTSCLVPKIHSLCCHIGFFPNIFNPYLFIYHHNISLAYILLYVNDIILTTFSDVLPDYIMSKINSEFAMKNLGPLNYFLEIFVTKHTGGFFLSQKKCA